MVTYRAFPKAAKNYNDTPEVIMRPRFSTQNLTKMALLTTMICISAYIIIPLPFTPITLTAQTLIVNLIALLLSPGQAVFSISVYLLLGLIGLPVFSGGMGGPAKLFGPTGGYLLAYLFAVALMSWLKGRSYHFIRYSAVTILVGMPVIYFFGSLYMKWLTGMDWMGVLTAAVFPFIPLDLFKCLAAAMIARPVQAALSRSAHSHTG